MVTRLMVFISHSRVIAFTSHIWCECERMPVHVKWLFGGSFLEEKHKTFLTGEITKQEFEQYLWDNVNIHCSAWLKKNIGGYYG